MPTVNENIQMWDHQHAWPEGGDEWSAPWGNAERQWQMTVYPRIANLQAWNWLEIGPGMGRWTQKILPLVDRLDVVDISAKALEGLEERVLRNLGRATRYKIGVHLGNGTNLPVESGSVHVVFSFDSLVHADQDTLDAYLIECSRVLDETKGVGFIHHANKQSGNHWRGNATADGVRAGLAKVGLHCYVQELSTWVHEQDLGLTDCFTTFGKIDRGGPKVVTTNVLMEAYMAKRLSTIYDL